MMMFAAVPDAARAQSAPPTGTFIQITPVLGPSSASLNITLSEDAASSSSGTMLGYAKQLAVIFKPVFSVPIATIQFLSPDSGVVMAAFTSADFN